MKEESELLAFVKGRLEGDVSPEPPRLAEIVRAAEAESFALAAAGRSRRRLWASSLTAASLAVVVSFAFLCADRPPSPEDTVACVIDLLRTADGDSGDSSGAISQESAVAEMLLAWQDAPYESAIADL